MCALSPHNLLTRSGKTEVPDGVCIRAAVWAGAVAVGGHQANVGAAGRGCRGTEAAAVFRDARAEAAAKRRRRRRGLLDDEVLVVAATQVVRLPPAAVAGKACKRGATMS